jgi:hypothetical protein
MIFQKTTLRKNPRLVLARAETAAVIGTAAFLYG